MAKVNGLDIVRIPINGKNTLRVMRNGKELWNWTGLPSGYTLLEYIQSNGTQYVDTGVTPKQNTRVVLECGGCTKTGWMEIFGAGISVKNPERNYLVVSNISNGAQMQYGSEYYTSAITNNRDVIDVNKNILYINGVLVKTFSNINFTSPKTLRIFDANTNDEDYPKYEGKIYYCKIYNNDILIRDYVPMLRSDGVAGLYDKLNKVFYPSASGTPFTGA